MDGVPVDCVVVLTAEVVVDGSEVIWARPTPAAAAKASPTITPTRERRLNRLKRENRLSMPLSRRGRAKLALRSRAGACAPRRRRVAAGS